MPQKSADPPVLPLSRYIGRFAPSPTGRLHFGSLVSALVSYLDARQNCGTWLVRIEDLDPPREIPGSDLEILEQLEQFGLEWDGELIYQSSRQEAYLAAIDQLRKGGFIYPCTCTRKQILHTHPCRCADRGFEEMTLPFATRLRLPATSDLRFTDRLYGLRTEPPDRQSRDFIIRRKDQLIAYQLAVVVDDAFQQITHVVRGSDLIESTFRQLHLQQLLNLPTPIYCHTPLIVDRSGVKLSKQRGAEPVPTDQPSHHLVKALSALNQRPPADLKDHAPAAVLTWAIEHFQLERIGTINCAI